MLCLRSIPFHFNDRFNFLFCFTNISAKIFSAFLPLGPATYCAHFSQMLFPLKNEGKSAVSFCHRQGIELDCACPQYFLPLFNLSGEPIYEFPTHRFQQKICRWQCLKCCLSQSYTSFVVNLLTFVI